MRSAFSVDRAYSSRRLESFWPQTLVLIRSIDEHGEVRGGSHRERLDALVGSRGNVDASL